VGRPKMDCRRALKISYEEKGGETREMD